MLNCARKGRAPSVSAHPLDQESSMSNVTRICPECGHGNAMDTRYCAQCGYDSQSNLPATQGASLPAVIGKAAIPVLVGAASLALSAGLKLLQNALNKPTPQQPIQVKSGQTGAVAKRSRMTITIRTSWAVGDSSGKWEKGQAEQTIELGE
jgi:ribosomal protein S27AE